MNAQIERDENGYEVMGIKGAVIERKPFRDFSGENSNGNHHFAIRVPEECLNILRSFGFDPHYLDGKDGQYEPKWILDIVLGYKFKDPGVFLVTHDMVKSRLKESDLADLDDLNNIAFADMELTRHCWKINGRSGVKPYGQKLHIYLSGPSWAERQYMERCNAVVQDSQIEEPVQQTFVPVEDEDIPF